MRPSEPDGCVVRFSLQTASNMRLNSSQVFVGIVALSLGGAIYVLIRPADSLILFSALSLSSAPGMLSHQSSFLWGSLPSLLHVLAFSLITASAVPRQSKRHVALVILFWVAVNVLFELGQTSTGKTMASELNLAMYCKPLFAYFMNGTYDVNDILLAVFGGAAAYPLILITKGEEL